jgi:hypothetical protein
MRSWQYLDIWGERRTKTLCVRNIRLHKKNVLKSNESREIIKALSVSLTFKWQKKETRDDTRTHQKTNDKIGQKIMCPVRAAAELVHYLYNCKLPRNDIQNIKLNSILDRIRSAVCSLGKEKLGFTEDEVGMHSNRSRGAMGMFLAGTPVYTIMLIGSWSSDAFMHNIRKQVLEMSHGISTK